jgi:hypothetical protein
VGTTHVKEDSVAPADEADALLLLDWYVADDNADTVAISHASAWEAKPSSDDELPLESPLAIAFSNWR